MAIETKIPEKEKKEAPRSGLEEKAPAFDLPTPLPPGDNENVAGFLNPELPKMAIKPKYVDAHFGKKLFVEPYFCASGHVYEKEPMQHWLKTHDTDPKTNERLENKDLRPARDKHEDLQEFLEEHPKLRHSDALYLPRYWVKELEHACVQGDTAKIQQLCEKDKRLVYWTFHFPKEEKMMDTADYDRWEGRTIFHVACGSGTLASLHALVAQAEKLSSEKSVSVRGLALGLLLRADNAGLLPIHHAILGIQDAHTLLTLSAWMGKERDKVALPKEWKAPAKTALNEALAYSVLQQDVSNIRFFVQLGADVNLTNNAGETLVYLASKAGLSESLVALLEAKADPNKRGESLDDTPLHVAVRGGNIEMVRVLRKHGATFETTLKDGNTPLHLAVEPKVPEDMLQALCGENSSLQSVFIETLLKQRQLVKDQHAELERLRALVGPLATLPSKKSSGSGGFSSFFEEKARPKLAPEKPQTVIDAKEVEKLLKCVVEGEQDEAEKLIKAKPELLLGAGKVTDLSGRTFEKVTAFQYAVWALDWHMWKMLLSHFTDKGDALAQYEQLASEGLKYTTFISKGLEGLSKTLASKGPLLEAKGSQQTPHIDALIKALGEYIENPPKSEYDTRAQEHWQKVVGGAQRLLPVHVVNEYCRADRSFKSTPTFLEDVLPRTRKTDEGDWFTGTYNGGGLGEKWAGLRGWVAPHANWGAMWGLSCRRCDHRSLLSLLETRVQQREELVITLKPELRPSRGVGK